MSEPTVSSLVEDREVAGEEEIQMKAADIKAEIAKNERAIDQCDETIGRYNREFLYNVRDLEKLLTITECPLTQEQLKKFGICPSLKTKVWRVFTKGMRKRLKQNSPSELEMNRDSGRKPLIDKIIAHIHKFHNDPKANLSSMIGVFCSYKLHESPELNKVISTMLDMALEHPNYATFVSDICHAMVKKELKLHANYSLFRNAVLHQVQAMFVTMTAGNDFEWTKDSIEIDEKKRGGQQELDQIREKFEHFLQSVYLRSKRLRYIKILGQLYLREIVSIRIILICTVDLLKSVTEEIDIPKPNEQSIECAVLLLKIVGQRVEEENLGGATPTGLQGPFPLDKMFGTLKKTMPHVGDALRFSISKLVELRKNRWNEEKSVDEETKKINLKMDRKDCVTEMNALSPLSPHSLKYNNLSPSFA